MTDDYLSPPLALPPLSLPLPVPRTRTCSDQTDPDLILLTPTDDNAGHTDSRGLGSKVAIREGTPYPSRPICLIDTHDVPPVTSLRLGSELLEPRLPVAHQAKYHTAAVRDHPPKTSGPVIIQRILELTSVIDQVYTAYTRLNSRIQSPILLLSLRQFRDRSIALQVATRIFGQNLGEEYTPEGELEGDERYVVEELERLEGEWWTSEVVANWFGPLPRQTQYRERVRGRGGDRTQLRSRQRHNRPERGLAIPSEDELGSMDHIDRPDLGDMQGIGEVIMNERAVDRRRLFSFVGLWDE